MSKLRRRLGLTLYRAALKIEPAIQTELDRQLEMTALQAAVHAQNALLHHQAQAAVIAVCQ